MTKMLKGVSVTDDPSKCSVLLAQPVFRHPSNDDVHSPAAEQYFRYARLLSEKIGFFSLVTNGAAIPPVNLLSLTSYLREQSVSVQLVDLNLKYLCDGRDPEKELLKSLKENRPKILGLSAMESFLLDAVFRLAKTAKKYDPELFIVLGGVNATAMDEKILKTGDVDAVVRGEGEVTFAKLCQSVLSQGSLSNVRGISYLEGGEVIRNLDSDFMDLSALPLPARDIYPLEKMYDLNGSVDAVYASRGCPNKCLFCNNAFFWKRKWRGRDPDDVVRELLYVKHNGARVVFLYDMNLGFEKAWTLDLCKKIVEANLQLVWGAELTVSRLLDIEFLGKLYNAGCRTVFVGIESVDQRTLSGVEKGYSVKDLDAGLETAAKIGINVETTVMIGMPRDTEESIQTTTDKMIDLFQRDLLKLVHYSICIPWPGTELGDHPEKYGMKIVCQNHRNLITSPSVPIASTKYLSADQVYSFWEDGVVKLIEEMKEKLLFAELHKTFGV